MKKLLVLLAVLSLVAGAAYAADLNDGLTRQVWNQAFGRSVVSDGSVAMRIWYIGSASPAIGVSPATVNLYENGELTAVSINSYGTVQKSVEYVNTLTSWRAAVGPDLYGAALLNGGGNHLVLTTTTTPGTSKLSPTEIKADSGTRRQLSVGIEATEGKWNRIKSVSTKYAATYANGTISLLIYDGDKLIWRKDTSSAAYSAATGRHASPDTVSFIGVTDKGIAASNGRSLVAVVSANTAVCGTDATNADYLSEHNISIVYDQF